MVHQELLTRIEEQAVEIAELRKRNEELRTLANGFPERIQAAETRLLEQMARGAVNCGRHSGCWLAGSYLENMNENKENKSEF